MGIADKVPPNLKFAFLGLTLPNFIIFVLVLVGCTSVSPAIPNFHLFLLQVNDITLRVGYFAVCAMDAANSTRIPASQNGTSANGTSSSDGTICVPTLGLNASDLSVKLFGNNGDVVPILDLALTLQRNILVPVILIASFFMLFGVIFFALSKVTQMKLKDPNSFAPAMKQLSIFKPAALAMLWMSVMFAFAAAVASTMAVGALSFIIPVLATNIKVTGGKVLQALQYLSFIYGALVALGATLVLSDPLERQGESMMGAGEYPPGGEKGLDPGYDESMMQQQQLEPGMEGQAIEGQVMDGQQPPYPEGEYPQQQYAEGQEQQQQPYAEGGEYAQEGYTPEQMAQLQAQQQQQQQQQQQYPQQPYP